ncbi:Ig-like domain-containing protein [Bradyrhizobium sp. CCGB12]|uniref:Ig-like domain-containing protein n=1 Tax=Bradyrhizobium sp. CCGB12 TaxID=2949632 RepID=UPI0020B1EBB0|nr:Ig-like domain-containing protein [Bradyrhizobium sp. CCGB12]MCP3391766.1 Ig-like domain-containing protein [Bradyrhizobium sp. CCGB12]
MSQKDVAGSEVAWGSFRFPEPAKAHALIVPDAHLLFSGEYARSGHDLIISDPNHRITIPNYFLGDKRSPLSSADGALLDARVVEALTGYQTFAQAGGNAAAGKVIGRVATVTGSASIVRNGVTIEANNGDVVYQNDVVQTGSSSTLGLVLIDGTTFNLSANARFMLNELGYEGQSSASGTLVSLTSGTNHSMFTLIQGAASFVAGQVAKTGDMQVATPTAVIGIRGTAVLLSVDAVDGKVSVSVADQQDGRVHSVQVYKCDPTSLLQGVYVAGEPIGIVTSDGPSLTITPTANFEVVTQTVSKTPGQVAQEFNVFQQVLTTYDIGKQIAPDTPAPSDGKRGDVDTKSLQKFAGSPPPSPTEAPTTVIADDIKGQAGAGSITPVAVTLASITGGSTSASKPLVPTLDTSQAVLVASFGPVIISSAGGPINQGNQTISGTVDPSFVGSTVTLYDTYNGATTQIGTVTVGSGGVWSIAVTLAGDGDHSIVALDPSANVTTSVPVVFNLDTTAPTVEITSTSGPVSQASQTITGTVGVADAGATVTILDGATAIGTAIVQSNGTWSTTVTLVNGPNSLTARVSDAAGNTATSSAVVYTLSTTGPTVTEALVADTGTSATDHVTANPALSGTGLANTLVHFTIDGSPIATTVTTDAQGAWSFTPSGLADGPHTIVASQTDTFGNTGSASLSFTLDTTAPTIAIASAGGPVNQASQTITGTVGVTDAGATVTILDGAATIGTAIVQANGSWSSTVTLNQGSNSLTARVSDAAGNTATSGAVVYTLSTTGPTVTEALVADTGTSATDHVTANPALNGTGLANTAVHLTIDGVLSTTTTTTDAQGAWSFTPSGLVDGLHSVVASQTDPFGNTGSASLSFTLDTTAPNVAITSAGGSTNQASQTITGTVGAADVGATVTILDGTTAIGTAIVQGNGNWSTTVTLNQGSNSLTARVSDAAGNTAASSAVVYTLSTVGPTVTEALIADTGTSATDHVTANPALSGTGLANTAVHFTINGNPIAATVTTDAQGAWSFTPSGLADGLHTIVASQTDTFGNTGSASLSFTLDTAAPTVAITSAGGPVNQASQTITGTVGVADVGATVTILDGTTAIGTAIVQGNGIWSTTVTLNNGPNSLTARVSDAAGNTATSSAVVYTLSTTGPTVTETLVADTGTSATDQVTANPALSGTGLANTVVQFIIDGSPIATTVTTDAQGAWSFTPSGLADGPHTIVVSQTDPFGNTGSASLSFTLDTAAPTVAITSAGGPVNQASQTITGTVGVADAGVTVTILDGATAIGTAIVQGNGSWSTTVTLNQGSNSLTARVSDAAGNTAASSAVVYTLSTVGPTVTEALVADTGTSITDRVTANPALNGTGLANTVVNLTIDGVLSTTTVTADAQGAWSFAPSGLTDGPHTVVASQTDTFGNTGSASLSFTLDTTAPTVAITSAGGQVNQASQTITGTVGVADAGATVTILDGATTIGTAIVQANGSWSGTVTLNNGSNSLTARVSDAAGNTATSGAVVYALSTTGPTVTETLVTDTGTSATDHVTANPALSGAGLANTVVRFTIDGSPIAATTTTDAQGAWSFTPSGLTDGPHTVVASQTDTFGNTGSSSLSFILDTTAPTVAITSPGGPVNQASQTITGTVGVADAGATVTILDGTTAIGTAIVQGNGGWSTSVTLNNGPNSLTARVSDAAGNTTTSAAVVYTLSTIGPTVTEILAADTGTSATDHVTANPALSGIGLANTVVHFTIDGSPIAATTTTDAQGAWSFAPNGLSDGPHTIVASQTDTFGNAGSASLSFTLDTSAPTVSITSAGGPVNQASQTITGAVGVADAGTTVTILDGAATIGTAIVQANGSWSSTVTLNQGSNSLTARVSDAAGNTATSGAVVYTLSTVGPTVTEVLAADTGSSVTDHVTANPGLNGTGLANTVVHFTIDGSPIAATTTTDAQGAWSFTPSGLTDGPHTIVASQTDPFGNTGSASLSFTLDTTSPAGGAPDLTAGSDSGSSSTDNITSATSPSFTVSLNPTDAIGDTVQLLLGGSPLAHPITHVITAADVTAGNVSLTVTAGDLGADGAKQISAQFSDAAGNSSTTASLSFTLDATAPNVAITSTGGPVNQASQTITGTVGIADAGATVTILDGATAIGTAIVQANGSWSSTVTLNNGANSLTARVSDAAGNTATSSAVVYTLSITGPTVTEVLVADTGTSATDHVTADPALSGTGIANTLVHFTIDGSPIAATVTTDAQGAWSFTPSGLTDGPHTIVASQTDTFGNTGSASLSFTLDTTAPTVAITSSGGPVNQASQAISGTVGVADAGATVTILDGTTAIGTAIVQGNGSWSTNVTLANGPNSLTARVSDAAGNTTTSSAVVYTLSTVGPTVTEVLAADTGSSVTDHVTANPGLNGTGLANTVVHFTIDGSPIATTVTTDAQGAWSFTPSGLSDGPHTIVASQTDPFGNTGSASLSFTLDTTAPAGGAPDLTAGSDSGSSSTDNITSATSPSFTVSLNPTDAIGDTVQLLLGGSPLAHPVTHVITAADVTAGSVTLTVTGGDLGADGAKQISAQFNDVAGNSSTTAALSFTLDTTAPTVAITSAGGPVNQASQTITGTVGVTDAGATVTILDGATAIGTAIVQGNGAWSSTVTLNQGGNSLAARVSDAAGNTTTSGAVVYTLSTVGPTVTEVLAADTGTSVTDHVTANPTVSGTGLANTVVHLTIDGVLSTSTVTTDAQGAWSFTPSGLSDGPHTVVASQTDTFGNTGSASLSFTLDTTAPSGGTPDLTTGSDSGISGTDNITSAISPSFTVALNPAAAIGDTVQLLLGGSPLAHPVTHVITAADVTAGSVSVTVAAGDLGADGAKQISAQFSDAAGNSSTTASLSFTLDTTAPTVAITSPGGPVNQASQTITGTVGVADAGATVTILDGATTIGTAIVQGNGSWSSTVTLNNGANSLTARVSDAAGNTTTNSAVVYFVGVPGAILGDAGDNSLTGTAGNDAFQGFGGNDTFNGLLGVDRAVYVDATGAITADLTAGTVTGPSVGTDTLVGIEAIQGSNFADHYSAVGFSGNSGVPGTPVGFNSFEGMGGDDIIVGTVNPSGEILTRISYVSATAAVVVDFAAGTTNGDASVGNDSFTNVNMVIGSAFGDTLRGSDNPNGTFEQYDARAGNDLIDGRGGYDFAVYSNDVTTTTGITVNFAAGTVTGDATIGADTLRSVEAVRGTNFADTYNATGFSGTSINAGSSGTFNNFEGMGGNDNILGNGNTRLQYTQSTAGVTVDLLAGTAIGDGSVGNDTFAGVNSVMGSIFADTFSGSGANENFMGLAGDDFIDGKGGFDTAQYANLSFTTGGISVHLAAGTVTGDASSGTDTLRSIEGIQGTNFADTYDATNFGVTGAIDPATGLPYANSGNNGTFNQFEGMGGNDVITGNGNTRLTYANATGPVTITFSLNGWTSSTSGASGTVTGDGSVGTDIFSGVSSVSGSSFADTITGSNNPNNTSEEFAGRGGNDFIDGKTGFDRAFYNNDGSASGIQVNMASGVVTGDASIGADTLRSIEAIRGTAFADTYVATNFGVSGPNLGDFGTLNEFEGMAGNDSITGNGSTRIAFYNAQNGVTVDLIAGNSHGTVAGDLADVGTDTFADVNAVRGSTFGDVILGDANANALDGRDGNDRIDGRAGADTLTGGNGSDTFVYADGGGADTITDFDRTQGDTIDLTGMSGIFTLADVQAKSTVSAGNTIINFGGGNTLTLIGVTSLQQSDFVFPNGTNGTSGSDVLLGTSQADAISGLAGNDRLQGFGGNDLLDGGADFDRAVYTDATGGISVSLTAGTASGPGVGTDTLVAIEGAVGSDFADTFNASGFVGITGTPGTPIGFNEFEGRGGNDTILSAVNVLGAALTRVSYVSATAGVTVDIAAGTADGNGTVGHDTFVGSGILAVWGSSLADTLFGSNNGFATLEVFAGFADNDVIDGRGGFDRVDYNNDPATTSGITVNLAAGTLTGDSSVGTDTLVSIEAVRGTNFADTYNASGFSSTSTNSGSLGTFNEFTGEGGNDIITGNGNTRIGFNNATAGVVVDIATGTAAGNSTVGSDTFTGVNAVMGTMFTDSLSGSGINETFTGLGGNDTIDGRGGFDTASYNNIYLSTGGVTIDMATGTATGDSSIGTDTLRSIEAIQGTALADTYVATGYGLAGALNVGNNGSFNQFEGLGGDDVITGNGNTRLTYANATGPVTIIFGLNSWTSTTSGASGSVTGDGSVGTDTFSGVGAVSGSSFADTITGSNNPNGTAEDFAGRGGNDLIDGKAGFDRAFYNNDGSTSGIQVDMASGVVTGDASIGTDTLRSIEAIRGTNFDDILTATNFGTSGANAGDFGTLNEFEGMDGNDAITGNGNTRIAFYNALDGVTVDLAAGNSHGTASGDLAGTGTDSFVGVNAVRGSAFTDFIFGDAGSNTLDGQAGNDVIQGRGGADTLIGGAGSDQFVFAAVSDSTIANHDTISDFVHAADTIDTTAIAGVTSVQGLLSGSAQIDAHSIGWIQSGANTIVYVNSSTVAQNQGAADMEIVLSNVTANTLTSQDFLLHI